MAPQKLLIPSYWMICREPDKIHMNSRDQYTQQPNPKRLYVSEEEARRDAEALAVRDERAYYLLHVVNVVRPIKVAPPVRWDLDE